MSILMYMSMSMSMENRAPNKSAGYLRYTIVKIASLKCRGDYAHTTV